MMPLAASTVMPRASGLEAWSVSPEAFPADGGSPEKLQFCLNYAILAPSTHNTQPWLFHMTGNQVELHADFSRQLRAIDPEGRELIMSCGAALSHLVIALNHFGYAAEVEAFPVSEQPDFVARVGLGDPLDPDVENVLLFNAIPRRRTNRLPFKEWRVQEELLVVLQKTAETEGAWLHLMTDDAARSALADLVAQADRLQWADKAFREEMSAWVHPGRNSHRDGMPDHVQGTVNLLAEAGSLFARAFDRGAGHAIKDRAIALQAPTLGVLGTEGDTPAEWLAAGQALARVLLRARAEDVWASFLNQPVQVPTLRSRVCDVVGRSGYPQAVFRLGFGPEVHPTPRRPLRDMLVRRTQVFKLGHYALPGVTHE